MWSLRWTGAGILSQYLYFPERNSNVRSNFIHLSFSTLHSWSTLKLETQMYKVSLQLGVWFFSTLHSWSTFKLSNGHVYLGHMIACAFDDVKLLQNMILDYFYLQLEMGRDFVHACGGTFAYIIWPGDTASSEHMDNCLWCVHEIFFS